MYYNDSFVFFPPPVKALKQPVKKHDIYIKIKNDCWKQNTKVLNTQLTVV